MKLMTSPGGEFGEFIKRQQLPKESEGRIVQVTQRILQRTELLEGNLSSNCQLVVGEVQSGKTLSFTALIALAHDNGFPLVIVLAGTKNQLLTQTKDRLTKDLRADGDGGANPWFLTDKLTKKDRKDNARTIQRTLEIWLELDAPRVFKPTVVITCLKNRESLDEISHLVNSLNSSFNINDFPVLIVDDEGDQAGLNLRWADDEESPIYAAINRLRNSLQRHSYVMYTATPQGPLLIGIQDALSPKFVTVLQSGPDYLGGRDLFSENNSFVKYIPNHEYVQINDLDLAAPVPKSLKQALAYYLLALYVAQKRALPKPISMLVHPSALIEMHLAYENWVKNVLYSWEAILRDPSESTYKFEKANFFLDAEVELKNTVDLPSNWNLDDALREIRWWIKKVDIRVINSKRQNIKPDEWKSRAGWIVIGGNNLERGFTIENLAVTYMPRSTGGGNVDVIQQRGRFFGYKRNYLDLLRGWFFLDKAQAYYDYVTHENSIRSQLESIDNNNEQLSGWRRRFLLDPAYNPVRKEVMALNIVHRRLSRFKQHMLFDPELSKQRDDFLTYLYSKVDDPQVMPNDFRKNKHRNYFNYISVDEALEVLADWPMAAENRAELDDTIWALRYLADEEGLTAAALILMDWDPDKREQKIGNRSMLRNRINPLRLPEEQGIANIFQGPGGIYPGDDQMILEGVLTLQVHRIKPIYVEDQKPDVVALALVVPPNSKGFVAEYPRRSNSN
jgi:hypothetical protein